MELKELMEKLHHTKKENATENKPDNIKIEDAVPGNKPYEAHVAEKRPKPPKPPVPPQPPRRESDSQSFFSQLKQKKEERGVTMEEEGITLDLGDGISLNIPIRKRMSLSDFLRVAEKVKALEILAEEAQQ